MKLDYISERNLYYLGILLLVLYSFPNIGFIAKWVIPTMKMELFKIPVITAVAVFVGIEAFRAWRWREIG